MTATKQQKEHQEHKHKTQKGSANEEQKNRDAEVQEESEKKEKERANYWDRITDDPASGYGADRSEDNDTLERDSSTDSAD